MKYLLALVGIIFVMNFETKTCYFVKDIHNYDTIQYPKIERPDVSIELVIPKNVCCGILDPSEVVIDDVLVLAPEDRVDERAKIGENELIELIGKAQS